MAGTECTPYQPRPVPNSQTGPTVVRIYGLLADRKNGLADWSIV